MRVTRILDIVVIVLLAVVLLMPRPNATVKAALRLPAERRERVAELQALLVAHPESVDTAIELANIYLDGHRPDWALATVGSVLRGHEDDFRLHHLRAIAYADRFESPPAFEAASKALALCERPAQPATAPCGEADHSRLALLQSTLQKITSIDMRQNPALAKEKIFEGLHPVFVPRRRAKAATGTATGTAPKAGPTAAPVPATAPAVAPSPGSVPPAPGGSH